MEYKWFISEFLFTRRKTDSLKLFFSHRYVTEHNCTSTATESQLQEARLSFPSGHSSFSTYAFVFLFVSSLIFIEPVKRKSKLFVLLFKVYFEARLLCPKMKFLRPFLQCLCIAIAFFTCLSRVTDYKHHPSDVIGGAILGFSVAVFTVSRQFN